MAWLRVRLTVEEQRIVNEERTSHPNERIRERMLVICLLHNGVTRQKAAEIVGVGRATVQRYVVAFATEGWTVCDDGTQSPRERNGRPIAR